MRDVAIQNTAKLYVAINDLVENTPAYVGLGFFIEKRAIQGIGGGGKDAHLSKLIPDSFDAAEAMTLEERERWLIDYLNQDADVPSDAQTHELFSYDPAYNFINNVGTAMCLGTDAEHTRVVDLLAKVARANAEPIVHKGQRYHIYEHANPLAYFNYLIKNHVPTGEDHDQNRAMPPYHAGYVADCLARKEHGRLGDFCQATSALQNEKVGITDFVVPLVTVFDTVTNQVYLSHSQLAAVRETRASLWSLDRTVSTMANQDYEILVNEHDATVVDRLFPVFSLCKIKNDGDGKRVTELLKSIREHVFPSQFIMDRWFAMHGVEDQSDLSRLFKKQNLAKIGKEFPVIALMYGAKDTETVLTAASSPIIKMRHLHHVDFDQWSDENLLRLFASRPNTKWIRLALFRKSDRFTLFETGQSSKCDANFGKIKWTPELVKAVFPALKLDAYDLGSMSHVEGGFIKFNFGIEPTDDILEVVIKYRKTAVVNDYPHFRNATLRDDLLTNHSANIMKHWVDGLEPLSLSEWETLFDASIANVAMFAFMMSDHQMIRYLPNENEKVVLTGKMEAMLRDNISRANRISLMRSLSQLNSPTDPLVCDLDERVNMMDIMKTSHRRQRAEIVERSNRVHQAIAAHAVDTEDEVKVSSMFPNIDVSDIDDDVVLPSEFENTFFFGELHPSGEDGIQVSAVLAYHGYDLVKLDDAAKKVISRATVELLK